MKTLKFILFSVVAASLSLSFQSCNDDDTNNYYYYPNALVTVKTSDKDVRYLQLDEKTTLYAVNLRQNVFDGKEVRALCNLTEIAEDAHGFDKAVHINWIDSILTKQTVQSLDLEADNDKEFGKDPVEIVNDWITIAEDGYLTLRFRTHWGVGHGPHRVNLLTGVNPDNPYEVEFRHDANGDVGKIIGDGLVAFRLKDLPDTNGETVKLKLTWHSFSGRKSVEFDYCSRRASGGGNLLSGNTQFKTAIQ